MVQLIFTNEALKGRSYDLVCEKTTIGRSTENLLCIRHPSLSRRHCEVLVYGYEVIVRDLGSRNGTFVNGKRLFNQQCQVKSGQVISIGLIQARLQICVPVPKDDEPSGYFDISKYRAEIENLQRRQSQSGTEWTLVKNQSDRTIEMHIEGESVGQRCVIVPTSIPRSKRYGCLSIGLMLFVLLALTCFWLRD